MNVLSGLQGCLKWVAAALIAIWLLISASGCQSWANQPPIEAFAQRFMDEAVAPAIGAAISEGVEGLQLQAGAQAINPTYVADFTGKWVVGVEGEIRIGVEGVSGQLQVSARQKETAKQQEPTSVPR